MLEAIVMVLLVLWALGFFRFSRRRRPERRMFCRHKGQLQVGNDPIHDGMFREEGDDLNRAAADLEAIRELVR